MLVLKGHGYRQAVYDVAFSPDGAALASCGLDGTVRLWGLRDGAARVLAKPQGRWVRSVTFAPAGGTVTWADHHDLHVLDVATGQRRDVNYAQRSFHFPRVRYSPDGALLAVAGIDLDLLEVGTWRPRLAWGGGGVTGCVAFAPDGRRLAAGVSRRYRNRPQHAVHLFDPARPGHLGGLPAPGQVTDLAFAPDGSTLAGACGTYLAVWDTAHGREMLRRKVGAQHVKAVAFTPDGRFLLWAGNDQSVRLLDARTWAEHASFDWDVGQVVSLAVAADGMRAAAGGRSGRIVVWDLDL